MKWNEIIQIVLFFGLGVALTPPVGRFMAKVFTGEKTFLHPLLLPIERAVYRLTGADPAEEMTCLRYFWAIPLAWQGIPQTWKPYVNANLMESYKTQVQKTDDKGNNVTTNIQLVLSTPKTPVPAKT